nr:radical SAM protein [Candidatus Njordarchaeota archaeon]
MSRKRQAINLRDLEALLKKSWSISRKNLGHTLFCYAPSIIKYEVSSFKQSGNSIFLPISITGGSCALGCNHCNASILRSMVPATSPQRLIEVCIEIASKGGKGCLISGGATSNGSVPLARFIDAISYVKKQLKLTVVVHTGLANEETSKQLAQANIDAALIDVIGNRNTIKEVYHLDASPQDYERSMRYLSNAGIPLIPHVLVGLHYGKISGEQKALTMIARCNPSALVFVVLMPLEGTPMATVEPPPVTSTVEVIAKARLLMPFTPMMLGCARPRGKHKAELDTLSIKAGINGIAYPSEEAIELAKQLGLELSFAEECCALLSRNFLR